MKKKKVLVFSILVAFPESSEKQTLKSVDVSMIWYTVRASGLLLLDYFAYGLEVKPSSIHRGHQRS